MSLTNQIASRTTAPKRSSILNEILIWNAAWREHQRLQRLDRSALQDMGLTEAARAQVTVAQIAARMRG